jgi:hypothetical protein
LFGGLQLNQPCPLNRGWFFPLQTLLHIQLRIETKANPKHAFPSKETQDPTKTDLDSDLDGLTDHIPVVRPALLAGQTDDIPAV